jgi:hypothetical protein
MAKYYITHSCGHEATHDLLDPINGRESRAAWLEKQPCMDCKRAAENAAAKEANAGLPALEGNEKQIAWAESIRAKKIAAAEAAIADSFRYAQRHVDDLV